MAEQYSAEFKLEATVTVVDYNYTVTKAVETMSATLALTYALKTF